MIRFVLVKICTLFIYAFVIGGPAFLAGGLIESPYIAFSVGIGSSMAMAFIVIHDDSEESKKWLKRLIMRYRHFDFID